MADDALTVRDKIASHLSLAGYRQPVAVAELLLAEHRAEIAAEVRGYASVMHHVNSRELLERVADDIETGKDPLPTPATQVSAVAPGGNAEDCPRCSGTNPPYPFLCPGHPTAVAGPATGSERPRCPHCGMPHDLDGWPAEVCRRIRENGRVDDATGELP